MSAIENKNRLATNNVITTFSTTPHAGQRLLFSLFRLSLLIRKAIFNYPDFLAFTENSQCINRNFTKL